MFEVATINTAAGAFAAGLATSAHCAGMCGPLACLAGAGEDRGKAARLFGPAGYHLGRLASYATIGALAGWLGRAPLEFLSTTPARVLPWALAAALVAIGFGLDKKIPRPAAAGRWLFKIRLALDRRSPIVSGGLLGIATPLLPCAPLYIMFGLALTTGSAAAGAEFTAAFALGTIPLLLVAGSALRWITQSFGSGGLTAVRRAVALTAAAAIIWRLSYGSSIAAPSPTCPLCP